MKSRENAAQVLSLSAVLHTHRAPIEWQNLQHIKVRRHRKIQFADCSVWCGPNQIIACPWRSTAEQIDYSISVLKKPSGDAALSKLTANMLNDPLQAIHLTADASAAGLQQQNHLNFLYDSTNTTQPLRRGRLKNAWRGRSRPFTDSTHTISKQLLQVSPLIQVMNADLTNHPRKSTSLLHMNNVHFIS